MSFNCFVISSKKNKKVELIETLYLGLTHVEISRENPDGRMISRRLL